MRAHLFTSLNLTVSMLCACENTPNLARSEQLSSIQQNGLPAFFLSVMGAGWSPNGDGTAEKKTEQGGKLVAAYTEEGLMRMRTDLEKSLSQAETMLPAGLASKETGRLTKALLQMQQLSFSEMRLDSQDVRCASVTVSLTGGEKCGCDGKSPVFSVRAEAAWNNCFKLSGRAEACIDGACQSTSRLNRDSGSVVSQIEDTGVAGTTLLGTRSGRIWGSDPTDATNKIDLSLTIPLTCTLPDCAPPPPPPPPPPTDHCSCWYRSNQCVSVSDKDGACYICWVPGDPETYCESWVPQCGWGSYC